MTATSLGVPAVMLVLFLAAWALFKRRPPEMSELGLRHFQTGLLFAVVSSTVLAVLYALWVVMKPAVYTPRPLLVLISLVGNVCNAIGVFCFFRELIPGGDITPEGMTLGLLTGIGQVVWVISGAMVLVSAGF